MKVKRRFYLGDLVDCMHSAWDSDNDKIDKVDRLREWCAEHNITIHRSGYSSDFHGFRSWLSWAGVLRLGRSLYSRAIKPYEHRRIFFDKARERMEEIA